MSQKFSENEGLILKKTVAFAKKWYEMQRKKFNTNGENEIISRTKFANIAETKIGTTKKHFENIQDEFERL